MLQSGRARRHARQAASLTLVTICLLVLGFSAWYRQTYWVFPGQSASQRLHWCGRDYQALPGAPMTWRQISAQEPWPVRVIGFFPPLGFSKEALYASVDPATAKLPSGDVVSCTTAIYIRLGTNRYQPYNLLGGP
jgi:hypothetical protein